MPSPTEKTRQYMRKIKARIAGTFEGYYSKSITIYPYNNGARSQSHISQLYLSL